MQQQYAEAIHLNNKAISYVVDGLPLQAHEALRLAVEKMKRSSCEFVGTSYRERSQTQTRGLPEEEPQTNLKAYKIHGQKISSAHRRRQLFISMETSWSCISQRNFELDSATVLYNFALTYKKMSEHTTSLEDSISYARSAVNIAALSFGVLENNFMGKEDSVDTDALLISKIVLEFIIDTASLLGETQIVRQVCDKLTIVHANIWLEGQVSSIPPTLAPAA